MGEKIINERPGFTARWNQGFNILLSDVPAARLKLELRLRGHHLHIPSSEPKAFARLQRPFVVQELAKREDMAQDFLMSLRVVSPHGHGKANCSGAPGPLEPDNLDLDIRLALYALKSARPTRTAGETPRQNHTH